MKLDTSGPSNNTIADLVKLFVQLLSPLIKNYFKNKSYQVLRQSY